MHTQCVADLGSRWSGCRCTRSTRAVPASCITRRRWRLVCAGDIADATVYAWRGDAGIDVNCQSGNGGTAAQNTRAEADRQANTAEKDGSCKERQQFLVQQANRSAVVFVAAMTCCAHTCLMCTTRKLPNAAMTCSDDMLRTHLPYVYYTQVT